MSRRPAQPKTGDIDFRELHASERIGIVTPGVLTLDSEGEEVAADAAAIAIVACASAATCRPTGRPLRFDPETGPVCGILSHARHMEFSWLDDLGGRRSSSSPAR